MDKSSLNIEILNCKPVVTKAKVHVIRDIRKKIGILKRCKNEKQKEKKLKKAERLVEEIMTIKKLKIDEVMKFALRTAKIEDVLQTPSNLKEHACAVLAKHKIVKEKVESIRKRFDDWERDLVPLLDLFDGKRKKKKKGKSKGSSTENTENGTEEKLPKDDADDEENKVRLLLAETKKKLKSKKKKKSKKTDPKEAETLLGNVKSNSTEIKAEPASSPVKDKKIVNESKTNKTKPNKAKVEPPVKNEKSNLTSKNKSDDSVKKSSNEKNNSKSEKKAVPVKVKIPSSDESSGESDSDKNKEEEKVVDPFFVNKKILKPKIIDEDDQGSNSEPDDRNFETNKFNRNPRDSIWNVKRRQSEPDKFRNQKFKPQGKIPKNFPEKRARTSSMPEEELHPSWAAKKSVKPIIQPFQGKKIKFGND